MLTAGSLRQRKQSKSALIRSRKSYKSRLATRTTSSPAACCCTMAARPASSELRAAPTRSMVLCTDFFGTNPTLEIDLVLTSGGKQFYYTGADDCVTSNPSDTCDHFPISGQCTKQ